MKKLTFIFTVLSCCTVYAQDMPVNPEELLDTTSPEKYTINGYIRSGIFADNDEFRDVYAEGNIKLQTVGNRYGNAFAEIRYTSSLSSETDDSIDNLSLREGYINLFAGNLDLRIGRQIIVWGRADGFNPTNNLTPVDLKVFSPEEDDKRLPNFVARATYSLYPAKIEIDWVPAQAESVLPVDESNMPGGITWDGTVFHDSEWKKGSAGIKLDIQMSSAEGSVSYYNGYHKLPGICYSSSGTDIDVFARQYRSSVLGADFSTSLGRTGLRGEFAYSRPDQKNDALYSVPHDQIEYTIGLDREWGDFSLIIQYIGKYILDFQDDDSDRSTLTGTIILWNRMISSQQERWNHSLSLRPSLSLFHETLELEALGLVNFSTEEIYVMPKATYEISDAFSICIGAQIFSGPDDTLYGLMEKSKNAGFVELKISF